MKKPIYYVIAKELQNSNYAGEEDAVEETTGQKNVAVYTVEDGKITPWFNLDLPTSENTHENIIDYLIANGHTEESEDPTYKAYYDEFDFIEL